MGEWAPLLNRPQKTEAPPASSTSRREKEDDILQAQAEVYLRG